MCVCLGESKRKCATVCVRNKMCLFFSLFKSKINKIKILPHTVQRVWSFLINRKLDFAIFSSRFVIFHNIPEVGQMPSGG